MSTIKYLKGDATLPKANGQKIICHICNDLGGWGKGFVLAISKRWQEPEKDYRAWYRQREESGFALGETRFVDVTNNISVANMIAQRGMKAKNNESPIKYDAVNQCLMTVSQEAINRNASVHMPRIGCGLAGGKWKKIEPIIVTQLISNGIDVYVYDY